MGNEHVNKGKKIISVLVISVFAFITVLQPVLGFADTTETLTGTESSQSQQQATPADEEMNYENSADSWRYEDGESEDVNGEQITPKLYTRSAVRLKGIDVSAWQGNINWQAVKNSGIDFAIIRCGYWNKTDSKWIRNVTECERLGIPYGVYIYSYAESVSDANMEANNVLKLLEGHTPSYPVYYDLEDKVVSAKGISMIVQMANTFCSNIEANGYRAGIYANLNWWNNKLYDSSLNKYEKWVAQWYSRCEYEKPYGIWQYSSDGSVSGISGRVDMNYQVTSIDMTGVGTTRITAAITDVTDYEAYVTASSVNYRTGPGTGYVIKGSLSQDAHITITDTANGWGKLTDGNWIKLTYVKKLEGKWIEDEESRTVFQMANGTVAKSQFITYMDDVYYVNEYGEKLTGFQTIGTSKYYFGSDGIVKSSQWITYSGKKYYLMTNGMLATGYKKIGSYYYGFDSNGVMLKGTVNLNGKRYVFASSGIAYLYTTKIKTALNYRTGPSTAYKRKGTYKKNKVVTIIREQSGWGMMTNGYWIKLSYTSKVTRYPQAITTSKPATTSSYRVKTTTALNYRTGPNTSYKRKGTYRKGTVVTIKSTKSGWGKMSNGYWIKLSYTKRV